MENGLHKSCPVADFVLFIEITAAFYKKHSDVQPTRHGGKHEWSGTIVGETIILL